MIQGINTFISVTFCGIQILKGQYFSCLCVAQRPARRARVQRGGHGGSAHAGHGGGGLPRVPRHRAVHHPRHPREGTGAERRLWQHRLRRHRAHASQVHGTGQWKCCTFIFRYVYNQPLNTC